MELPDKVFNVTYHLKRTTRPIVVIRAIQEIFPKHLHDNETCIYIFVKFSFIIFGNQMINCVKPEEAKSLLVFRACLDSSEVNCNLRSWSYPPYISHECQCARVTKCFVFTVDQYSGAQYVQKSSGPYQMLAKHATSFEGEVH